MKKILVVGLMSLTLTLTACGSETKDTADVSLEENEKIEDKVEQADSSQVEIENKSVMTEVKNEGQMAYDFNFPDLDGNMYKLSDQKGKKVYVKFWASWCPVCLSGLSEVDEMSKNTEDYEVVTVVSPGNLGEKNKEEFIDWFKSLGYENTKVLLDESGQFIQDYAIRSTPTNVIVGSDGVLVSVVPGQLNKETIDKIFQEVQ